MIESLFGFNCMQKMFQEFILVSDQIPLWIALAYTRLNLKIHFISHKMNFKYNKCRSTGRYRVSLSCVVNATAGI